MYISKFIDTTRVKSILFLFMFLVPTISVFGELALYLIFILALLLGLKEFYDLVSFEDHKYLCILSFLSALVGSVQPQVLLLYLPSLALVFSGDLPQLLYKYPFWAKYFVSFIFQSFLLAIFYQLNFLSTSGPIIFISLQLIASLSDTLAYLSGKILRGPRASIAASPHKTISGFCGALILTPSFYRSIQNFFPQLISFSFFEVLILTIAAIFGDLMFSALKRLYAVKDFSNLIPGHGGILDRIDSLISLSLVYMFF